MTLRFVAALLGLLSSISAAHTSEKSAALVPRFVSLRADDVNLRTGPGLRYPIEWVFHRKGYPLEIIAQFDDWRQVRDWQGTEGWVQEDLVTGKRSVVVTGAQRVLRDEPDKSAAPVARIDPGVIARLLECRSVWCRIEVRNGAREVRGWLGRREIWGVLPDEVVK